MKKTGSKKVKILHVANMSTDSGVACFLMNYIRNMDFEKIDMDFLCWYVRNDNFHEEIEKLGGRVICVTSYKKNPLQFFKELKNLIKENHYDIVHAHEAIMSIPILYFSKKYHVKNRIAHSHNSAMPTKIKDLIVKACRHNFNKNCTELFACSNKAGQYLFGKAAFERKGKIVRNAIQAESFTYDEECRRRWRNSLDLEGQFVIGHVGRFNTQKNHLFLIEVFRIVVQMRENSSLLLIGEGETLPAVKHKVEEYGLESRVHFLGVQRHVNEIMQAMDAFVFPSVFEGLGIVLIEAQSAGLPCFTSDVVPIEAKCTKNLQYISLNADPKSWAKIIIESRSTDRGKALMDVKRSGYDIKVESQALQDYYLKIAR